MLIGLPKETKLFENRVSLIPKHVALLVKNGHRVYIEKDTGVAAGFTNQEYKASGAEIVSRDQVYKCPMIVRVKRPQLKTLKQNQILLGYLHVEKGENPELLNRIQQKKITAFANHLFKDAEGKRLVNLGYEAGVVGIYEGLRLHGKLLKDHGEDNPFYNLPSSLILKSEVNLVREIKKISRKLIRKPNIYIIGNGLVAKGCKLILNQIKVPYFVLHREETRNIKKYLHEADILINATYWLPGDRPIITRKLLKDIKPTTPIIDVSCEEAGAVETTIERTWANPTYKVDGITHFAVGNLPSAVANDSTVHLSKMTYPYVLKIANGDYNNSGLIVNKGILQKIKLRPTI